MRKAKQDFLHRQAQSSGGGAGRAEQSGRAPRTSGCDPGKVLKGKEIGAETAACAELES